MNGHQGSLILLMLAIIMLYKLSAGHCYVQSGNRDSVIFFFRKCFFTITFCSTIPVCWNIIGNFFSVMGSSSKIDPLPDFHENSCINWFFYVIYAKWYFFDKLLLLRKLFIFKVIPYSILNKPYFLYLLHVFCHIWWENNQFTPYYHWYTFHFHWLHGIFFSQLVEFFYRCS